MSTARGLHLPTTRGDWRLMGRTVRLVLTLPVYAAVAAIAAVVSLTVFVVAPVLSFGVTDTLLSNRIPLVWVTVRSFIIIHSPWGIQSRGGRYDDRSFPRSDTPQRVCKAAVSEEKNYVENDRYL